MSTLNDGRRIGILESARQVRPMRWRELGLAAMLLAPAFLIMAVVTLYPLISSFLISLRRWDLLRPEEGHPFVGLDNYAFVLGDPTFWQSVRVTVILVVLAVKLEIILG